MRQLRAFVFAGTFICSGHASAQGHEPVKWMLSTEVIQDLLLNLNARAYRVTGRWSLGIHSGYRPSLSNGGTLQPGTGLGGDYADLNWRNWALQAYTLGPCVRFGTKGGGFLELDAFHRLWWFDRKYIQYSNVEDNSFEGVRSERTSITAVRLLWGGSAVPQFKEGKLAATVIEGYIGIGYRWKQRSWTMHSGIYNGNVVQEQQWAAESSMPTFHLGVRLVRAVRGPQTP